MAKVLYVEDDGIILRLTLNFLSRNGHNTFGAFNGYEGLEVLAKVGDINIIFSDFNMPAMDGYDFSRKVKANPNYTHIPIVGIGDFPMGRREHLVECHRKPFEPDELIRCIKQYCS